MEKLICDGCGELIDECICVSIPQGDDEIVYEWEDE